MRVEFNRACHPRRSAEFYDARRLSLFAQPEVLDALYGDGWWSVLVDHGPLAMLHAIVPRPIGDSGCADVESWLGYAGPQLNQHDSTFASAACAAYSTACAERGIVAEMMRFDPLRTDVDALRDAPGLRVVEGRLVAYVDLDPELGESQRLATYTASSARQIRSARRRGLTAGRMADDVENWDAFRSLYEPSLARVGADRRWHLDDATFDRFRFSPVVSAWGTWNRDRELVSAAVVVARPPHACSLLVANGDLSDAPGAHDLLTHTIAHTLAGRGYQTLCLGGGRTAQNDDGLLRFKAKFCRRLRRLQLGLGHHDPRALARLYARAAREGGRAFDAQPSGPSISRLMAYRGAPSMSPPLPTTSSCPDPQ